MYCNGETGRGLDVLISLRKSTVLATAAAAAGQRLQSLYLCLRRRWLHLLQIVSTGKKSTIQIQILLDFCLFKSNHRSGISLDRNFDLATNKPRSALTSPEKEDRYYATRGSGSLGLDDNTKGLMDQQVKEDTGIVWPRLFPTLSSKEKEQDFMAMKGSKLPQRPKKRAKLIQKSILVSHSTFLYNFC